MAANIPDQGAIAHLGGQFQHNVFDTVQKKAYAQGKKTAQARAHQAQATQNARNAYANSAAKAVQQGRQQLAKKQAASANTMQQQRNYAHGQAIGMQNQMDRAKMAAQAVQQRHAVGVAAHQQKAAINLNLAQQKHQASTSAHAQKAATSINALAQKQQIQQSHQSAMAAGKQKAFDISGAQKLELQGYVNKQKLQHQANMHAQRQSQKTVKPVKAATPTQSGKAPSVAQTATPTFSNPTATHTPVKAVGIPQTSFSSQLAPQKPVAKPQGSATASFSSAPTPAKPAPKPASPSVTGPQFSSGSAPKASGGYPQHVHPEGSSTAPLPNLTAAQPKPNTFTVGSRNAKPGGLAARGSQLEAWAIGRQAEIRKQRGSNNTQLRLGD